MVNAITAMSVKCGMVEWHVQNAVQDACCAWLLS